MAMAFAAANVRLGHGSFGLQAAGLNQQLAAKAQKTFYHAPGQGQVFTRIGPQNFRHGTAAAEVWLPGFAGGVGFGQAADLLVAAAMKVSIVIFALLPGWCSHAAIIL